MSSPWWNRKLRGTAHRLYAVPRCGSSGGGRRSESSLKMRQTCPSEAETKALRTWVWWRWRTNKSHEPLEWMSHWCLKRIKPCGNVFYMLPVREALERKLLPIFYSCSCGDYIQNPVPDWQKSHGAPRIMPMNPKKNKKFYTSWYGDSVNKVPHRIGGLPSWPVAHVLEEKEDQEKPF